MFVTLAIKHWPLSVRLWLPVVILAVVVLFTAAAAISRTSGLIDQSSEQLARQQEGLRPAFEWKGLATPRESAPERAEALAKALAAAASAGELPSEALSSLAASPRELGPSAVAALQRLAAHEARQAQALRDTMAELSGTKWEQRAINDDSRRIAELIGTIDGIVFQTNILTLNAAVEVARASEQDPGFAVVAGEVRNLAQRSATAAREVTQSISDNSRSVGAKASASTRCTTRWASLTWWFTGSRPRPEAAKKGQRSHGERALPGQAVASAPRKTGQRLVDTDPLSFWCGWQDSNPRPLGS